MSKLFSFVALCATVLTMTACSPQEKVVAKAAPVKAITVNYHPPKAAPVKAITASQTDVANCVAETRALEANKDLPKKLSGFRKLPSPTSITLASCAGDKKVVVERLVDDTSKAVTHETLWGEVHTAMNDNATAAAQAKANATAKAYYDAGYKAALKDAKATGQKQAAADQKAAALAAAEKQHNLVTGVLTFIGIVMALVVAFFVIAFVRTRHVSKKRSLARQTPEAEAGEVPVAEAA